MDFLFLLLPIMLLHLLHSLKAANRWVRLGLIDLHNCEDDIKNCKSLLKSSHVRFRHAIWNIFIPEQFCKSLSAYINWITRHLKSFPLTICDKNFTYTNCLTITDQILANFFILFFCSHDLIILTCILSNFIGE